GYNVFRGGTKVGTSTSATFTDSGLFANTTYSYTVSAYDAAGNTSALSSTLNATTAADTVAPTVPAGLPTSSVSTSSVTLTWTASTDANSPVTGYKVYRNGTQVGTPATTTFTDTGLAANTSYSYTVAAYDPTGNTSAQSSAVNATTAAAPDSTAP